MNHHHPPPPPTPTILHLQTTNQIIHHTTTTIFSTRRDTLIFLVLSWLLLSIRANIETATHSLISFIDNDPSVQTLISRIQLPPNPPPPPPPSTTYNLRQRQRHRPFLQLTRVGTLDDDFFSGDEELDHRFFGGNFIKPQLNATLLILDSFDPQFGFSNFVSDNGIRVLETVKSSAKMSFKTIKIVEKLENISGSVRNDDGLSQNETDFDFLLKRFDLDHQDASTLVYLVGGLAAAYGFMILGFVATHSWVHGVVFVLVVNGYLKSYKSFVKTFWNGANLGMKRLCGFIVMRWVVRDALTQLLGVWYFGEIEDQYSLFKIFVRLKFIPYSNVTPWIKGFDKEIYGFMLSWFLMDMLLSFVFAVDACVVMVDSRKSGKEVIKEGWHLLTVMIHPAINLKCLEGIVCGSFARHVLTYIFGKVFTSIVQSFMEVYFIVAWMFYYFSVKSMDARSSGVPFGQKELETMLEDDR
uniref:uncharacterized protein LOC122595248 n=1 Tax=Erigeron canadensis TaxID=72917 RepID=UPI001CB8D2EF|nr:uncharacterized protein LOC122595248 [Erigeron canadensis]